MKTVYTLLALLAVATVVACTDTPQPTQPELAKYVDPSEIGWCSVGLDQNGNSNNPELVSYTNRRYEVTATIQNEYGYMVDVARIFYSTCRVWRTYPTIGWFAVADCTQGQERPQPYPYIAWEPYDNQPGTFTCYAYGA